MLQAGLVERADDSCYSARSPIVAARSELDAREAELRRQRALVDELLTTFEKAEHAHGAAPFVEVVEGREEIHRRILEMQTTAEDEYVALVQGRHVAVEPEQAAPMTARRVLAVFDIATLRDPGFRALVRDRAYRNYHNRTYPGVPMRLAIADRRVAMVSSRPDGSTPVALQVRAESLLLALRDYFDTIWEVSAPMLLAREGDPGEWAQLSPGGLSERDRELLSMLLNGLTNEAIAAHWGISRRSVVRLIHDLMARTNATSRVHLGWEAHRRGWLDG